MDRQRALDANNRHNLPKDGIFLVVLIMAGGIYWLQLYGEIISFILLCCLILTVFLYANSLQIKNSAPGNMLTATHNCGETIFENQTYCPKCGMVIHHSFFRTIIEGKRHLAVEESVKHYCGETVSKNSKFCHYCGDKIETFEDTFIHECGITVQKSIKFCPNCGKKVYQNPLEAAKKTEKNKLVEETKKDVDDEENDSDNVENDDVGNDIDNETKNDDDAEENDSDNVTDQNLEDFEKYKQQTIKLGTVGKSAMGKSSFINTILGMKETDHDFARTGLGNTTMEPTKYVHPHFDNFTIWDTPGFGTVRITKKIFLEKVKLKTFDFIFIFLDTIITEDDIWIAKKLSELKVPFCFVRCKLDLLIDLTKQKKQSYVDEVEKLRLDIMSDIKTGQVLQKSEVFLISNKQEYFQYGDWVKLIRFIGKKIEKEKVESLFFFLPVLSPEMLKDKYDLLKKRIWKVSTAAGAIAAIPIPILDVKLNVSLVDREVQRYRDVLGLNSEFAKSLSAEEKKSNEEKVMHGIASSFKSGIGGASLTAMGLLSQADLFIPVVGSAISSVSVGLLVRRFLYKTLDETYKEAVEFFQNVTKKN